MLPAPNFAIAAIFYVFFATAVVRLAVMPGVRTGSLAVTLVGMAWGTFVTGLAAGCGFLAARIFAGAAA